MDLMVFCKTIGRFFFEKKRISLFFALLCAPFALTSALLLFRFFQLHEAETMLDGAALQARSALEKRERKARFLERYGHSEPWFLNQHLETLPLLQAELKRLQQMVQHPACYKKANLLQRIAYLQGTQNRLGFAEESVHSSLRIKETQESLLHPVEIDGEDLNQLLSLIENRSIGGFQPHPASPQLLIREFQLSKKDASTYKLHLSLLKREFQLDEKKN